MHSVLLNESPEWPEYHLAFVELLLYGLVESSLTWELQYKFLKGVVGNMEREHWYSWFLDPKGAHVTFGVSVESPMFS